MNRLKMKYGVLVLILIIASILCSSFPAHAKTITQAKYVVLLAEKLGLGTYLIPEEVTEILQSVYIVPKKEWQLDHEVTCELVDEVQVLAIKSSLKGLIRNDPNDIPALIKSLSDRYRICPETEGISHSTVANPPPMDSALNGSGKGKGSASE